MSGTEALPEAEAHDHSHADVSGGWLRAAVFGAMDGLVSNTALVAGVGRRRGGAADGRALRRRRPDRGRHLDGAGRVHVGEDAERAARPRGGQGAARARAQPRGRAGRAGRRCCACAGWRSTWPARSPSSCPATRRRRCGCTSSPSSGSAPRTSPRRGRRRSSSLLTFSLGALLPLLPYLFGFPLLWAALRLRRARAGRRRGAVVRLHPAPVVVRGAAAAAVRRDRGRGHLRHRRGDRRHRRLISGCARRSSGAACPRPGPGSSRAAMPRSHRSSIRPSWLPMM